MKRLDCVIVVDGVLTPMAERQLAVMLRLHAKSGITTGVFTLWKARGILGWPGSRALTKLFNGETLTWLDPKGRYSTGLLLVLSPGLAGLAATHLPKLQADAIVIWPVEPPRRGQLSLSEQAPDLAGRIGEQLGGSPIWCARTASERHHLAREAIGLDLAPAIWWPLLRDPASNLGGDHQRRCRVGRHWLDDRPLGPTARNELAEAIGDAWPLDLAFHGYPSVLKSLPPCHENQGLHLIDAGQTAVQDFLQDLALFVALGAGEEPFGVPFEMFEAMADDVLVVAPSYLPSAIDASMPSADSAELSGLVAHLMSDNRAYQEAIEAQRQLCLERHTAFVHRARISPYLDKTAQPNLPSAAIPDSRRRERVLFISDDSPHLEHLSREVAIADHLPEALSSHFVTTGRDASLVEQRGYPVEFVTAHNSPSYRQIGHGADGWNFWFERQLAELLAFVDPRAVVFDGVYPFGGMMANRKRHPDIAYVWIRQPLWRSNAKPDALALHHEIDLVIEPGDLAADFDRGPTASHTDQALQTAPILTADLLPRETARRSIGLDSNEVAVLLDGSLPPDVLASDAVSVLLDGLTEGGVSFWTFHDQQSGSDGVSSLGLDVRRIGGPSMLGCRSAFDAAISAADYRGLHDQAAACLPTIFIAGLGSSNDDQAARIAYAEKQGWAQALRQRDVYGARDAVHRLLDAERRRSMASGLEGEPLKNGASKAALAIAETVFGLPLGHLPGDGLVGRIADVAD